MFHFYGRIRDYNPTTDLASIDFDGIGQIESWLDSLKVDPALNRAYLVHGAPITVQAPDTNHLCEAIVVGVGDTFPNTTASFLTLSGRGFIATNASGAGSAGVTFSTPFPSTPNLKLTFDNHYRNTISGLSTTGFTVNLLAGGPANAYAYFSWMADGP